MFPTLRFRLTWGYLNVVSSRLLKEYLFYCLLPFAYYLLPIACCLLPIALILYPEADTGEVVEGFLDGIG